MVKKVFVTLIDDCTQFCYVYLFNFKDESIDAFNQYKSEMENQLNLKINMIRSGRDGEYKSLFAEICLEYSIIYQIKSPYTPQSNRVTPRATPEMGTGDLGPYVISN